MTQSKIWSFFESSGSNVPILRKARSSWFWRPGNILDHIGPLEVGNVVSVAGSPKMRNHGKRPTDSPNGVNTVANGEDGPNREMAPTEEEATS